MRDMSRNDLILENMRLQVSLDASEAELKSSRVKYDVYKGYAENKVKELVASQKELLKALEEAQKAIFLLYECNKDVKIALGSGIQLKKAEKAVEAVLAKAKQS